MNTKEPASTNEHSLSESESSLNAVQVEQKSYEMPPRDGFTITLFITVADINRSADFYEKVFGGRILSRGDSKGASGHFQIANTWLIVNVGGGPTPDKPTVTLSVLADQDKINSFMNIRVADIHACYGKAEVRCSSRSRSPSTARFAATSAIRTVISSRSDRAPTLLRVSARAGWDARMSVSNCDV
jgi:predicted enzyme related to lactoylglutathione lyase